MKGGYDEEGRVTNPYGQGWLEIKKARVFRYIIDNDVSASLCDDGRAHLTSSFDISGQRNRRSTYKGIAAIQCS